MTKSRVALGIAMMALGASVAGAQQSPMPSHQPHHAAPRTGESMMGERMMMDSLNRHLDSLVDRMNQASGNEKVEVMATVITELVAQRKAMQHQMHHMMDASASRAAPKPAPKRAPKEKPATPNPATDTSGHAAHHPPQ